MKDFEIRCDESRLEPKHTIYGKFTIGPFLPGQGTTFGNVLRRSLLSELSGLAITAFEVLGIMQEFSTLPGLRESVLDLSLNLKQITLTGILPYSIPPIGFLKIRGPAVIKAADLKFPAGIYCTSPNQYIATLSSNGTLNLKFLVSVGKGYSTQPYSFYHSLSKVKLQSTLSSDTENNPVGKNSLGFPKEFFEQQKSEYNSENLSENVHTSKTSKNQKEFHPSVHGEGEASLRTKAMNSVDKSFFNNVKELENKNLLTKVNNTKGVVNSAHQIAALSTPPPASQARRGVQAYPFQTSVAGGAYEAVELTKHLKSRFSTYGKTENVFTKDTGTKSQRLLQPRNLEFLNSTSTYRSNANETRTSNSVDIQTQIFQRLNPHQVLPIDAVFTPVSRVNFLTQVNDRFEIARENIVLEIWTNGSIHPKRALEEATLSLVQNFDTLLKKIQQGSSFYKGLRYWSYLQSLDSKNSHTTPASQEQTTNRKILEISKPSSSSLHTALQATDIPSVPQVHTNSTSQANSTTFDDKGVAKHTGPSPLRYTTKSGKKDSWLNYETNGSYNSEDTVTSNIFAVGKKSDIRDLSRKYLHQAIYNLDIGNLDLSLETFILLKEAKINTLAQLLTHFSPQNNKMTSHTEDAGERNSLFLSEKIVNELNNLIHQFQFN